MNIEALHLKLDTVLSDAVENGDVPHAAGVVTNASNLLYQGQVGPRRLGENTLLQKDTVYWIHSMTKPLTTACVMRLVEQGRINLNDDRGKLIPALDTPSVFQ